MTMFLLGAVLKRLVTHGTLTLTGASGREHRFGTATKGWPKLGLRFHDKRVPGASARNPSLGMAEAFMDGRLAIKGGDIMDFVAFVWRNNPSDKDGDLDNLGVLEKMRGALMNRIDQVNQRAS